MSIISKIRSRIKFPLVIVGIGNSLRGDDGAGPYLINLLSERIEKSKRGGLKGKIYLVDAGEAPENYTGKIASLRPNSIILVDAIDLGKSPGEVGIVESHQILDTTTSTHNFSLRLVCDYLKERTRAPVLVIGIQPQAVDFGKGLSDSVRKGAEELAQVVKKAII